MIYLLHGFGSSVDTSQLVQTLLASIESYNGLGICPIDYNSTDPNSTFHTIDTLVSQDDDDDEKVFIGVSLGGFWARFFANKYPDSKLIMINPALEAPFNLAFMVGKELAGTVITEEFIEDLDPYNTYIDKENIAISVIVCMDDDIIPPDVAISTYKDRGHVLITFGGHRLQLTEEHIVFINKAINNIAG